MGGGMNISTVNELIQSLESAGELSIKETKVMALAKAFKQLAAENVALKATSDDRRMFIMNGVQLGYIKVPTVETDPALETIRIAVSPQEPTPATDRIVAGIKDDGRVEGAHFVANRMLAAWDAGFIEDTAKNAADIARMILTSTEFMAGAPEGDFDRSFADGILEDIAQQLREGAK
jgi:hypothetical protein